jgi:hypothetical protein
MVPNVSEYRGVDVVHAINKNRLVSMLYKQMFRTYRTLVRCSDADAEPRFDGVDWSFPPAETSRTRRGVIGCGLTALGGVGVRLSMIQSQAEPWWAEREFSRTKLIHDTCNKDTCNKTATKNRFHGHVINSRD